MLNEMGATGSFNSFGLIKDCMGAHRQLEDQLEGIAKTWQEISWCLGQGHNSRGGGKSWISFGNRAK